MNPNSNPQKSIKTSLLIGAFSCLFLLPNTELKAQNVGASPEYIKALTAEWTGERFPDGRPKVSDSILERLKNISIEEAWGVLRNKGYQNQYEGDWQIMLPDEAMTGRVVTAQYMPLRPDLEKQVKDQGVEKEGRSPKGGTNSWPIDILTNGDVYVADGYGKIVDGTLIGDNLGNAIYAKSQRGVVFNGSVRDQEGLSEIEGFNAWMKGQDPSYIQQMMLTSINSPIRIGRATVLPGDVVLAKKYGVIFIPAYLVEELVLTSEVTGLRDEFGHQRLREGKYLAGQIDSQWTEEIKKDFLNWLNNYPGKLPMTKQELDDYLKERNY
ncbi:RraA family protein [Algoriphagus yeomjeoni]|uniref:Putative 4-hydroxy-4-methyl-2-oxoglutarate aldolase n=1 Tax=Algoriphagus yeomjeoni TaxID=291403 RepID=A0A327PAQ3_9BACT|nr:RraA family protein [Algoriphagus yeomjeoni]RAI89308.1 regulator of RNase E activity RraA [Algoriphagus yeomjeoni]